MEAIDGLGVKVEVLEELEGDEPPSLGCSELLRECPGGSSFGFAEAEASPQPMKATATSANTSNLSCTVTPSPLAAPTDRRLSGGGKPTRRYAFDTLGGRALQHNLIRVR